MFLVIELRVDWNNSTLRRQFLRLCMPFRFLTMNGVPYVRAVSLVLHIIYFLA